MKKGLSLLLVIVLVISTVGSMAFAEGQVTYGDVLKGLGVIKGDATGSLNGDKELTRGELVAIISTLTTPKVDTFKSPSKASFADVPITHWAFKHVERAKNSGISNGLGNGSFGVNDKVTYKQAKAFMLNVLGYKAVAWGDIDVVAGDAGLYSKFAVNSTKFTRNMMFELICNTITAYKTDGEIFFETVRKTTNLGWASDDLDTIWAIFETLNTMNDDGTVDNENDLVNMSSYKFSAPLSALTDAQQNKFGNFMSKNYAEQFNGKEFKASSMSSLVSELTQTYDQKEYSRLYYALVNDETNLLYDYFVLHLDKTGGIESLFDYSDKISSKPSGTSYTVESVFETKTTIVNRDGYILKGYVIVMVNTVTKEKVKLALTLHDDGFVNSGFLFGTGLDALVY